MTLVNNEINKALKADNIKVLGPLTAEQAEVVSPAALRFLAKLHRQFNGRRLELLRRREFRQEALDRGELPDFPVETRHVRESNWTCNPPAPGLEDRRVEITGPVDRKMVINALNSGAKCFMADFEDSNSPTWENNVNGQINMRDANRRTISFVNEQGKKYKLNEKTATLIVRPRGWHLEEKHIVIDGVPVSGSLFDFAVYFYNNAKQSMDVGIGPYFYLPKMESYLEARLWNSVFEVAQDELGIPRGTIRATCLIETIMAVFEMDEFIYELREHSAGLNCGRWDYIFSTIKRLRNLPEFILPDRSQVTMTVPFMASYVQLLIKTCHRRGVHAMGGMAAQIPIKGDAKANEVALEKVKQDKLREVKAGHDGTWVAHPGLMSIAMSVFDEHMPQPNQLNNKRLDVNVSAKDLLNTNFEGQITEEGIRKNISIGVQYMEAWLSGNGCVPLFNMMEDAATAEISRSQLWQWLKHNCKTNTGRPITSEWVNQLIIEELAKIKQALGEEKFQKTRFELAKNKFVDTLRLDKFDEFLTTICYDDIVTTLPQAKL